ncbi:MAG: glycoside hydrolase family 13 protein [Bacteroidota bacterium]
MRVRLLIFALLSSIAGLQAQDEGGAHSPKLPEGVEESEYYYRQADGANFSGARVEPPFWWTGMAQRELEILIYDQNIRQLEPKVSYPGVSILKTTRLENPNYLFLLLDIGPGTNPGMLRIELADAVGTVVNQYSYELKARNSAEPKAQGVSAEDFIYLIMPDRFANGDTGNDVVEGMQQTGLDRDNVFFRHGGDLIGVMEHLDYLESLGVTALWLNPVLENDQPYESYHGYAVTDHYRIDARFGSNEQYRQLVQLAHERGMKVVMDVIFNHTGDQHWFINDLPSRDWIHQWEDGFPQISYRAPVHMDPYVAKADYAAVTDSWFDRHMPDLNQQHPQLANFLIQNSIWWTEYSGQDAFRIDTYAYCDQAFMGQWNQRMLEEYPEIGIFAETWVHGLGVQSWFTEGPRVSGHNSNLPGVTDYQMYYALGEALNQEQGWTSGVTRLYYVLAQDFVYDNPFGNVLFLDNHDLGRVFEAVGEDVTKLKSAFAMLLTLRGIPMIYYGTEIGMTGSGGAFGEGGRLDFPGGFPKDRDNKFKAKDRTEQESEIFDYLQRLATYRKQTAALQYGALTQYIPENGVYVYFRQAEGKVVMVAYNSNSETSELSTTRYAEQLAGFNLAVDIGSGESIENIDDLVIPAHATLVLELR